MTAKPSQILNYAFVSQQSSILKGTSKERDTISLYLSISIQEIMIYKKPNKQTTTQWERN